MNKVLALLIVAATAGLSPALAASDEELAAARQALEKAREDLARAAADLARLAGEEAPEVDVERRRVIRTGERPMIGVVLARTRSGEGVRLTAVTPGAPADLAGLESGDTILAIDGEPLTDRDPVRQAYGLFEGMEAGDVFELEVLGDDGSARKVTVEAAMHRPTTAFAWSAAPDVSILLDERIIDLRALEGELDVLRDRLRTVDPPPVPEAPVPPDGIRVWQFGFRWSGLELARLNPELGRYFGTGEGALVLDVSGLQGSDLRPGDVVVGADGETVGEPRDLMRALRRLPAGERVTLEVIRDGEALTVDVVAPEDGADAFFYGWRDRDRHPPQPGGRPHPPGPPGSGSR